MIINKIKKIKEIIANNLLEILVLIAIIIYIGAYIFIISVYG